MGYISQITTAVPGSGYQQADLMQFYGSTTDDEATKRKIKILGAKSGIETRYSVVDDFGREQSDFTFFPDHYTLHPTPSLSDRMRIFKIEALALSIKAVQQLADFEANKSKITHIITVTCTGMFAPGLDIELIQTLGLSPSTHRSSINFMGCNAAIIALKHADFICRAQADARVLVVCTELCSLHFQTNYSDDYLLSNLLFADGSAALIVCNEPLASDPFAVSISSFASFCIPDSTGEMAWQLSETGFIMKLSSYVADLIKGNIQQMLLGAGLSQEQFDYWAVHPGGKKIVEQFGTALGLAPQKLQHSYDILQRYGNMSSPTVLFVLKSLFETRQSNDTNKRIFSAAFGPGLTVETMQLEYV